MSEIRTDKKTVLKIGYKEYHMYFVKKIDGGATFGDCTSLCGSRGVIRIAKGQKKVEKANTILHEIIHALVYVQGLEPDLKGDKEEKVVLSLTNGLIQFMRDNPKVMNQIMKMIKKPRGQKTP